MTQMRLGALHQRAIRFIYFAILVLVYVDVTNVFIKYTLQRLFIV